MTVLKHVALQMDTKENAVSFYQDLLNANLIKEFHISRDLASQIFSIDVSNEILVIVFEIHDVQFEIFIIDKQNSYGFVHVCIAVEDISSFTNQCKNRGLPVLVIPKGEKELIFVQDFVGNLFEIKEK